MASTGAVRTVVDKLTAMKASLAQCQANLAPCQARLPVTPGVTSRYVRFRRTMGNDSPVSFCSLRVFSPAGVEYKPIDAEASRLHGSATPGPHKAPEVIDGNPSTFVITTFEINAFIVVDLGSELPIGHVVIEPRLDGSGSPPSTVGYCFNCELELLDLAKGNARWRSARVRTLQTVYRWNVAPANPLRSVPARFVKFRRNDGTSNIVGLANLRVFDVADNEIFATTGEQSQPYDANAGTWATVSDGNVGTMLTLTGSPQAYVQLDFMSTLDIARVVVEARVDGAGDPPATVAYVTGCVVEILNDAKQVLWTSPQIARSQRTHTFLVEK